MSEHRRFMKLCRRWPSSESENSAMVVRIQVSAAGLRAKAEVVRALSEMGMAVHAPLVMATSLARDVLTKEASAKITDPN